MAKKLSFRTSKKGLRAAVPLAAVALGAPLVSSDHTFTIRAAETATAKENVAVSALLDSCASLAVHVSSPTVGDEWTDELEHEFLTLAKKDALSQADPDELQRLEDLEARRNYLKHSFTLNELIWYEKQEEARRRLLVAMQEFLSAQLQPRWAGAKRNR